MEETGKIPLPGSRELNLKKSFKLGIRSLLTTCSREEFSKAFPNFSSAEQDDLFRLFIQVITSLHGNIEDEFESLCLDLQLGTAFDTVERLVEEQSMDPLHSEKSNVGEVGHDLLLAKKNEIQNLTDKLETAEKQKHLIRARIELLMKERQETSGTVDAIEKLRSGILYYGA